MKSSIIISALVLSATLLYLGSVRVSEVVAATCDAT